MVATSSWWVIFEEIQEDIVLKAGHVSTAEAVDCNGSVMSSDMYWYENHGCNIQQRYVGGYLRDSYVARNIPISGTFCG